MTYDILKNSIPVPAICTQCGGRGDVDPSQEKAVCEYCGTSFFVQKAIHNYDVQNIRIAHVESVNINKSSAVESVFNFVERQQEKRQQKIDEEKRRLEEEMRKQEEQRKKIINQIVNIEYRKRNIAILGVLFIAILILIFLPGSNEDPDNIVRINMPASSSDFEGENYQDVITELQDAGFINIKTEIIDDLIFGWFTKDGEVEQVEVDGDTTFSTSSRYQEDVEIVITYHTFPQKESTEVVEQTEAEPLPTETPKENIILKVTETVEKAEPTEVTKVEVTKTEVMVLTVKNSDDLVTLLGVREPYDPFVSEFARKYKGRIIEFDGNIAHMVNHGRYITRYDILIYPGDYSETTAIGPNFMFENVNISDLKLTGSDIPDTIGMGQSLRITAKVVEYRENSGLFYLKPISTEVK